MAIRKGLGRGRGKGYRNIMGKDPRVHSDSARGRKQPQRLNIPKIPTVKPEFDYSYDLGRSPIDNDFGDVAWRFPDRYRQYKAFLLSRKNPIFKKVILVNEQRRKKHQHIIQNIEKDMNKFMSSSASKDLKKNLKRRVDQSLKSTAPDYGKSLNAVINATNNMLDFVEAAEQMGVKIPHNDDKYNTAINELRLVREFSDSEKEKISKLAYRR